MTKPTHRSGEEKFGRARFFRFSLRTVLVLIAVLGVFLFPEISRQLRQRTAYRNLKELEYTVVLYDYEVSNDPNWTTHFPSMRSSVASMILDWFGTDLFNPVVKLSLSKVSNKSLERLADLRHLRSLHIGDPNQNKVPSLQPISHCNKLEKLELGVWHYLKYHPDEAARGDGTTLIPCHISVQDIETISNFKMLRVLAIGGPNVTDESIKPICNLKNLENLYLCRSNVSEVGIEMLRRSLPNVEISTMSNTDIDYSEEMEAQFLGIEE